MDERTGGDKAEAASGDLPGDNAWSVARLVFGDDNSRVCAPRGCPSLRTEKTARVSKSNRDAVERLGRWFVAKTHPTNCLRCIPYENKKHAVSTSGCAGCSGVAVVGAVRHKRELARKLVGLRNKQTSTVNVCVRSDDERLCLNPNTVPGRCRPPAG